MEQNKLEGLVRRFPEWVTSTLTVGSLIILLSGCLINDTKSLQKNLLTVNKKEINQNSELNQIVDKYKYLNKVPGNNLGDSLYYLKDSTKEIHTFACTLYETPKSRNPLYPRDFVGIKSDFNPNESLYLVFDDPTYQEGEILTVGLYGPKKTFIGRESYKSDKKFLFVRIGGKDFAKFLAENVGYGNYNLSWNLREGVESLGVETILTGEIDFTISP